MADAAGLLERYRAAGQAGDSHELQRAKLLQSPAPEWSRFPATSACVQQLRTLDLRQSALATKALFEGQPAAFTACLEQLCKGQDADVASWLATLFCDMLREDNSCFSVFEEALNRGFALFQGLSSQLTKRSSSDDYLVTKIAWLLSAIVGNLPRFFQDSDVKSLVQAVQSQGTPVSELGTLEAYVNLLKADCFRVLVWNLPGVSETVLGVGVQNAQPQHLYKCVFAMWLLSFDEAPDLKLQPDVLVRKLKDILAGSRVEKVIRLSLTVLKNFLGRKGFSEEVVELGVLEVVQQLEYEKWRDAELYDDIKDLASQISLRVGEMSNFDRYQRELSEGSLKWGFIHSSKFWADNALKFEQADYKALKDLAKLLHSQDATTLAVACHDLGEFVVCHPLGKKLIGDLGVKESVMQLMSSTNPEHREVRREALLCCQKFMLNKWGDMDNLPA